MRAKRVGRITPKLPQMEQAVAELLLEAARYAEECGVNPWEFAVEVRCLNDAGVTNYTLRWLVFHKLAQHGLERSNPNSRSRRIRVISNLSMPSDACVILTEAGFAPEWAV